MKKRGASITKTYLQKIELIYNKTRNRKGQPGQTTSINFAKNCSQIKTLL